MFSAKGVGFGIKPNGPVDREVPVLRIERADGSLKAVVFGYACHCTTIAGAALYAVSGDWAGHAQARLEQTYPGATALFITGCGADANPNPRGSMLFAHAHGLQLAGAVARALTEPMRPVTGPIHAAFDRAELPLEKTPGKDFYEAKLKVPATQRFAQRQLDILARGEALMTSYPAPLQVLRFGDAFTLVGISGETCVDYSLRLRRELPDERLWVAGYCNDVFAYVPSARILIEGGYEADSSTMSYNLPTRFAPAVEDTLVGKVLELFQKTGGNAPLPARK